MNNISKPMKSMNLYTIHPVLALFRIFLVFLYVSGYIYTFFTDYIGRMLVQPLQQPHYSLSISIGFYPIFSFKLKKNTL